MAIAPDLMNAPPRVISRYKAALIHLGISAALAVTVISLLIFVWYPWAYFTEIDGLPLVSMIVGIDVILGPLLTLIIFKQGKKYLRLDLTIIALVQICALSYGVWTGYSSRVVYAVFVEDKFHLVQASEIVQTPKGKNIRPEFDRLPFMGPLPIAANHLPEDELLELAFLSMVGMGPQNMPWRYTTVSEALPAIRSAALSEDKARNRDPVIWDSLLSLKTRTGKDFVAIPLHVRGIDSHTLLVETASGNLVDVFSHQEINDASTSTNN